MSVFNKQNFFFSKEREFYEFSISVIQDENGTVNNAFVMPAAGTLFTAAQFFDISFVDSVYILDLKYKVRLFTNRMNAALWGGLDVTDIFTLADTDVGSVMPAVFKDGNLVSGLSINDTVPETYTKRYKRNAMMVFDKYADNSLTDPVNRLRFTLGTTNITPDGVTTFAADTFHLVYDISLLINRAKGL